MNIAKDIKAPLRVLVVDDHPMVRLGVVTLINREEGYEVCGEAGSGQEAIECAERLKPDAIVMDLGLEDISGLEAIKRIHAVNPNIPVLVLSMHDEKVYAERTLKAGARGYVMKRETSEHILEALYSILDGEIYVSETVTANMLGRMVGSSREEHNVDALTDRELEVLGLLGQGLAPRHVAEELFISVKTVEAHRESMKRKLNIGSAAELTQFAVQWVQQHTIL